MFMSKSTSFLFMARNSVSGYGRKASRALTALFLLGLPLTLSAQTLTITNTLQLWLKADAGVTADANGAVSAWTDSSGKGNNAAQADPTLAPTVVTNALNNKPVLRFDGVNDHLDVADSDSISISGHLLVFRCEVRRFRHVSRGLGQDFRKFPRAQRLVHSTQQRHPSCLSR